jgi:hypothetical protein
MLKPKLETSKKWDSLYKIVRNLGQGKAEKKLEVAKDILEQFGNFHSTLNFAIM